MSNQAGNHPTGHDLTVLNRTSNFSIMSVAKRLSTFRTAVLHQAAPPPAIGGIVKPPKPNGKAHRIGFETNAPADRAKLALFRSFNRLPGQRGRYRLLLASRRRDCRHSEVAP